MTSSEEVKKAVGGYFQDPSGKGRETGSGLLGSGDSLTIKKDDMSQLKNKLQIALKEVPQFQKMKNQVSMTVTGEGLRIELLETEHGMFFESGRAQPTEGCNELLSSLARELGRLPNAIMVEGHTDAHPFSGRADYSNWELSTDRANSARRLMETAGLVEGQVKQVRGFAAQNLRKPQEPTDPANRRISIIVKYSTPVELSPGAAEESKAHGREVNSPDHKPASPEHHPETPGQKPVPPEHKS
jgi:chemotaxis protein MotB